MAKLIALGATILALTATVLASNDQPSNVEARIQIVENISAFRAAHPELNLVPVESTRSPRQQILYTLGNRVSGDRLVAADQNGQSWTTFQDVALTLAYPQSGVGAVISYIHVVVNQSSNLGRGYVVAGGIGQRYIQLVIEASRTNYFNYDAQIYGK
ncbi:uncharacterized protein LOC131683308 [Topomyia yanbarensis]|uniref:uncharacterized protein LOC131683308 n=1 Tax=Topomyia yanbarensis TaxID=2498891 RepID=UPI00273B9721|nr:uncharacterized protein LOC131683308 [Topomyia yanbarensis]